MSAEEFRLKNGLVQARNPIQVIISKIGKKCYSAIPLFRIPGFSDSPEQGECHSTTNDCGDSFTTLDSFATCCVFGGSVSASGSFRSLPSGACIPCNTAGCHAGSGCDKPADTTLTNMDDCCVGTKASYFRNPKDGICSSCTNECHKSDNCGDSTPEVSVHSFESCCWQTITGSYSENGVCHPCSVAGCHKETTCIGFPDITATDYSSCCSAGGAAFLDPLSEQCSKCTLQKPSLGSDPHFFIPLANGENMCFSIQGQPDFVFNLIKDKHVELNAQFVHPSKDESLMISNVSTFLGNAGLLLKCPESGKSESIQISAHDHSIKVGDALVTISDQPVIVQLSDNFKITIMIEHDSEAHKLKDGSASLSVNTEYGFSMSVKFYKQHLNLILTKTTGLTNNTQGLLGQFLNKAVEMNEDNGLLKFNNRNPILVKKGPAWPYLDVNEDCWYGAHTNNQGKGLIDGVYTDYIVESLLPSMSKGVKKKL